MSSREARANAVPQVREPYVIVSACDGRGVFLLNGVYPNNNKRGDFSVYTIFASTVDGVLEGAIKPQYNETHFWNRITEDGTYAIRITLAEALVLFLDPLVIRTKKMPPGAIPVIRWWQKHRQPGPQRFEDLVMPILGKKKLARIAENVPELAQESWRESTATEAEREELKEHQEKFMRYFFSDKALINSWFFTEAEIEEIGETASSSACDFNEGLLKSEKFLHRNIQMAAHMRLLYKLGGEYPDLADLWSTEVKIQTDLGRFLDSVQAFCVFELTRQLHEKNFLIQPSCRFFLAPGKEEKGRTVLRGFGAWSCFVNLAEDPILEDLTIGTIRLLKAGVSNIFQQLQRRLPNFDPTHNNPIEDSLTTLLLYRFFEWNRMYVLRHESPLASADKDPPSDFVAEILNWINEEKSLMDHAQEVSGEISRAFWDVACMAIRPELFDYPAENGGRGVRKTTPTIIATSRPPSFEEALGLVVAAFCSLDRWHQRFPISKLPTLKKCLTVAVHPPEKASVQRILCPQHFSLDEEESMVPSDELLHRATNGDDPYFTSLFKLMAVQLPHTTLKVLEGVTELGDKIDKLEERTLAKLEENRGTSTTKMPKEQCAGCGSSKETEKRPMKCSRCLIVRYCSVACQKNHWPVHKKVCAPVNK
jgi:hypothetical protein